jgi:DNA-binding response OmpR family regulator
VRFYPELPDPPRPETVVLLPFPSGTELARSVPRTVPFVGCGDSRHIAAAFRAGAADFLCDPWTENEFSARVGRLFRKTILKLPDLGIELRGLRLTGPGGKASLSGEESALFRILYREAGKDLSRVALRRLLWPGAGEGSRVVDETVSRLRRNLAGAGISNSSMEIRSIRGFGYRLDLFF